MELTGWTGHARFSVFVGQCDWVCFTGFRVHETIPLQMDSQLEIRRPTNVSIPRVLHWTWSHKSQLACIFRHNSLVTSFGSFYTRTNTHAIQAPPVEEAERNITEDNTILHHDNRARFCGSRYALCEEPALPILCVRCLVHAVPSLESWTASCTHLQRMDGARVGVECIPKYGY